MKKFTNLIATRPDLEIIAGSIIRDDNKKYYSPRHQIGGSLENFSNTKLLMAQTSRYAQKLLEGCEVLMKILSRRLWEAAKKLTSHGRRICKSQMAYYPDLIVYHIKPYAGPFLPHVESLPIRCR